jgi:hypothetical protein
MADVVIGHYEVSRHYEVSGHNGKGDYDAV